MILLTIIMIILLFYARAQSRDNNGGH